MKTIRVFSVPSHVTEQRMSGVDYARIMQPMTHLNCFRTDDYEFKVDIFDIKKPKEYNWIQVAKEYDVVYFNYTVLDWAFAAMGAPIRGEGKKMIMDIDDAIWYVRKDNPTYEQYHANNGQFIRNVSSILDEVDSVVCTSRYLRNVIVDKTYKKHNEITVIPNYIDLSMYKNTYPAQDKKDITIMHFGSTTHFQDLLQKEFQKGITRIMYEYPNVRFVTVGAFISELRYKFGQRYVNAFGDNDIYKWINDKFPHYMSQADIVVAPLEIDVYNKSKSFIKFLEYSSTKIPGIYQNIFQYQEIIEHSENGYMAENADDWYNAFKRLITDKDKRKDMGNKAYQTAKEYQMKDHIKEYAEVILKTLDMEEK